MKSRTIVCALAAASLGFGSLSFAQGYDRRGDNDRQGYQQRERDRRDDDRRGFQNRERFERGDRRDDMRYRRDDRRERFHYGARGPEWRRGGHIPPEYRNRQYFVSDWRAHRLSPPPRGYQWVQVGGDYVLVAIATGIIAQLILSQ